MVARSERNTAKPKKKVSKGGTEKTAKATAGKAPPKAPSKKPAKADKPEKAAAPAKADRPAKGKGDVNHPPKKADKAAKKPVPGKAEAGARKPASEKGASSRASKADRPRPPPPKPPPPKPRTLEERSASVETRLARASEEFRKAYERRFDMAWICHDAALEGVVYTEQELFAALDSTAPLVPDSSLQPVCDEIRRHREALHYCRDQATKKRLPLTVDLIKKFYLILHPEEEDLKSVKYRKEIPQHRLYFHEYAPPDKIGSKVRQIVEWVNDPETRKTRSAIRIAGRAHYDLLRTFPFPVDSGRVARLFLNFLLMRSGYPAAIIHSADRQRYYEALKGSAVVINSMIQEAIENSLASTEKLLDEFETGTRSF